jgi:hypothetical protein
MKMSVVCERNHEGTSLLLEDLFALTSLKCLVRLGMQHVMGAVVLPEI